jgi:hypothetical protein
MHLETQKTTNSQGNTKQRKTLKVSQYLTSDYTTQHGTGSVDSNIGHRYEYTQLHSPNF